MLSRLPFLLFITFAGILGTFLFLKAPAEKSLTDSPLPQNNLPIWKGEKPDTAEPALYNLFASWCVPCLSELPVLTELKNTSGITTIGIAWKDKPEDVDKWLERNGNPYDRLYLDSDGAYGIALGMRGVPETYLVDAAGIIRYHHIGPVTEADLATLKTAIKAIKP